MKALLFKGLQMGNGPTPISWSIMNRTEPSHIPNQQGTAQAGVTVPGEMWPCGTALHADGLQQGQVGTQCSGGDDHPPPRAHRPFCPCSQRGKPPAEEASCGALTLSGNGFLWRGLPGALSLLFFCVVFSVNQLSPRKHYTDVASPRYPTIKPLKSLTQTFPSSLWAAESTPRWK